MALVAPDVLVVSPADAAGSLAVGRATTLAVVRAGVGVGTVT
ncbi:MAG: hypothetical protein JWP29_3604, partial [Rhodoferax sp.]|nr:hypothetical protein [Rhodoferax sp.]